MGEVGVGRVPLLCAGLVEPGLITQWQTEIIHVGVYNDMMSYKFGMCAGPRCGQQS